MKPALVTKTVQAVDHFATGARMREARQAKGISQQQIADALGMSQTKISDLEKGFSAWSLSTVTAYNSALNKLSK
jgi:transcriptional regulator with XRE-family HTH domain